MPEPTPSSQQISSVPAESMDRSVAELESLVKSTTALRGCVQNMCTGCWIALSARAPRLSDLSFRWIASSQRRCSPRPCVQRQARPAGRRSGRKRAESLQTSGTCSSRAGGPRTGEGSVGRKTGRRPLSMVALTGPQYPNRPLDRPSDMPSHRAQDALLSKIQSTVQARRWRAERQ